MFYVESSNFYDDLMSGKMQMLNKQGIDEVIKIIRSKENTLNDIREYAENLLDSYAKEEGIGILEILDKENQDDKN